MGWILLAIIAIVLVFNMVFVGVISGKKICKALRRKYYMNRNIRILAELRSKKAAEINSKKHLDIEGGVLQNQSNSIII